MPDEEAVETLEDDETPEVEVPAGEMPAEWADHIKGLRKESAKYRTRAKDLESKYSKYEADEVKPFLAAADALAAGDTDVVSAWVVRNAAAALGVGEDVLMALAVGDAGQIEETAEETGLTPEKIQEMVQAGIQEALAAKDYDDKVHRVEENAKALGYTPETRDYMNLLWLAHHEYDGDLDKAHKALESEPQKHVDAFMEAKRETSRGTPKPMSGRPAGNERKVTLDGRDGTTSAADAALERLSNAG